MHDAEMLCSSIYMDKQAKTDNNKIPLTVDIISQAIHTGKKITFQHTLYNGNRERVLRNQGEVYSLSPYMTVWNSDRYYVVGWLDNRNEVRPFRIDRMEIPKLTNIAAVPQPDDFSPDYYYQTLTRMASDGQEMDVTLECTNALMNSMVDKFGDHFPFAKVDSGHFQATVHVATGPTFWAWVCEHSSSMKVAAPASAKQKYSDFLRQALEAQK